jgi:hypothetical protein
VKREIVFLRDQGKVLRKVVLAQGDFVAQGGEGRVYAQGETAFKIFRDPARAITPSKLAELARIADGDVLRPEALVHARAAGPAVGHTMPFLRAAHALGELVPRAFKQRMGLGPERIAELVALFAARVRSAHLAGALVVDLSELNFLVDATFARVVAIDVDSYETPSHPATAITPAVRDPLAAQGFTEGSDWFSFAVVSFQLFVGVHPYRGKHPTIGTLSERMRRHAAAGFDSAVRLPPVTLPLEVIPEAWRGWYRAVLAEGKRLAPPLAMQPPVVGAPMARAEPNAITRKLLFELGEPIRQLVAGGGVLWALTDRALYADGERVAAAPASGAWLALSPLGRPVMGWLAEGRLRLFDAMAARRLEVDLAADGLMAVRGDLYAKCGDVLVELRLHDVGATVIAAPRTATMVLRHATSLLDGAVVQRLLGATYLTIFPTRGRALIARIPFADDARVIDARADGLVAMLLVARPSGSERVVIRFDDHGHEISVTPTLAAGGLRFASLDRGICVSVDDEGTVDIFAAKPGVEARRRVAAGLGADLLVAAGDRVLCAEGHRVYRIATTHDGQATTTSEHAPP